jgi:hypothetical protein
VILRSMATVAVAMLPTNSLTGRAITYGVLGTQAELLGFQMMEHCARGWSKWLSDFQSASL